MGSLFIYSYASGHPFPQLFVSDTACRAVSDYYPRWYRHDLKAQHDGPLLPWLFFQPFGTPDRTALLPVLQLLSFSTDSHTFSWLQPGGSIYHTACPLAFDVHHSSIHKLASDSHCICRDALVSLAWLHLFLA